MKKQCITCLVSLLLALVLITGLSVPAHAADSTVTFEDGQLIVFSPGSYTTDTDLFENFKNVMPGDTLDEDVTVLNESGDCDYIKVYMKALPHDEVENPLSPKVAEKETIASMEAFLAQLSMKVLNGTEVIFDASPDDPDGLADFVYLGTLRQGESLKLDVQLQVPDKMGNDYMDRLGEVDWVFLVEGFDDPVPLEPDEKQLTVRKVWEDDGTIRPERIRVTLLRDGAEADTVELNEANQWIYTWDKLDADATWSVQETEVPEGYTVSYATEGTITTITNKQNEPIEPEPEPPTPIELTVKKVWDDDGKKRPSSVGITLYDGSKAIETVKLGEWNAWTYTWKDLDAEGNWQLVEDQIPDGYTPSYRMKDGVVTVTNTQSLIQTGQLKWPIPVLGGLGLVLVLSGLILFLKKRRDERA